MRRIILIKILTQNHFSHNLRKHYEGKLHECHCGSVFKHKFELNTHQRYHNTKIACEVCQKQYFTMHGLREHWRSKHLQTHGMRENRSKFLFPWPLDIWLTPSQLFYREGFEHKRSVHLRQVWMQAFNSHVLSKSLLSLSSQSHNVLRFMLTIIQHEMFSGWPHGKRTLEAPFIPL